MKQNKLSKYFKYAFGEILLVVIGILLALQINNWNNKRVELEIEQVYLVGLKNDITRQVAINNSYLEMFYNKSISLNEQLLLDYQKSNDFLKIDSLNTKLTKMLTITNVTNSYTTYKELMSTGQLKIIQNKDLRKSIVNYYELSEMVAVSANNNISNVFYPELFPVIKSSVILDLKEFELDSIIKQNNYPEKLYSIIHKKLENTTNELKLINALTLRMVILSYGKNQLITLNAEAEKIIELIEEQLNPNYY